MTFLDPSDDEQQPTNDINTGFIVVFALLSVASCVAMIQAIYECRRPIYNKHTVRFLFPWASFCMIAENATLAVDYAGHASPTAWADIVYALEATVAPSLLMSTFDVTYIIHKTRHVQFCGIIEGQTHKKNPAISRAIKWCMRLLSILLLILGLLVNFDVGFNPPSPQAGRVGWYYVITEPFTTQQIQVVLGLIPMTVVSSCCLYFSLILWKYGTKSSMVVHSSPFNPWFSPLFGTLALFAGQWFGEKFFPLLSNVGIFVFSVTILLLVLEVNKDLRAAVELNVFLGAFDDLRESEEKHQQEFQQERQDDEKAGLSTDIAVESEVSRGGDVAVEEGEVKRNSKGSVVEIDKDKVEIKKGKIVQFEEEKIEIE